ncbi:response regulator transcription factor [Paractinoplanes rhizophilus]|uniref:Response regulator transcription factor n=1 Tax=Paractinoplanes rhizophilus TaxID=1416877 RepID=A0ABW2I5A0_9ACTN|nr:response regulator transcription factor [Actinoplanes sp.]
MDHQVLIAEDDPRQAEVARRYLVAAGYQVAVVHDGAAALRHARSRRPDLIVLDVMMPGVDGLTVCRKLRGESDVPILVLTARAAEDDLVTGLDAGADDYLTKPYSPRELTARVRTLLRRTTPRPSYAIGRLAVDPRTHRVTVDGREIECTAGEFAILAAMAREPDRVFSRAQLLTYTRGLDRSSNERSVDVHVLNLRRKIEPDPGNPVYLRTVYGVGYRLSSDAS